MARSSATTVAEYLAELPTDRASVVEHVRKIVLANVPAGIEESMNFGMIAYEIPLACYPDTYNKQPLMYAALAAQKHHFALHLHSVYTSTEVEQRLRSAYARADVKLDMGKSCLRFRRLDQLAPDALADAIGAVGIDAYIDLYEASRT